MLIFTKVLTNGKVKCCHFIKRHKAVFDTNKCSGCPLKNECSIHKNKGIYYFTHQDYLQNQRNTNINKIPLERRKIRPNVEATIYEFKNKTQNGKLKVRGQFKAKLFAFAMGISINFGRIYRLIVSGNGENGNILTNFNIFVAQILLLRNLTKFLAFKNRKSHLISNIRIIMASEK